MLLVSVEQHKIQGFHLENKHGEQRTISATQSQLSDPRFYDSPSPQLINQVAISASYNLIISKGNFFISQSRISRYENRFYFCIEVADAALPVALNSESMMKNSDYLCIIIKWWWWWKEKPCLARHTQFAMGIKLHRGQWKFFLFKNQDSLVDFINGSFCNQNQPDRHKDAKNHAGDVHQHFCCLQFQSKSK